jgi:hypothetical protein
MVSGPCRGHEAAAVIGDRVRRLGEEQCGMIIGDVGPNRLVLWGVADNRQITEWIAAVLLVPFVEPVILPDEVMARKKAGG